MAFLHAVRINAQITIIGILALAGFVAVGATYFVSAARQAAIEDEQMHSVEAKRLTEEVKYEFLLARRLEQDFLRRRDARHAAEHQKVVDAVLAKVESLKGFHSDPAATALLDEIQGTFGRYVEQFHHVVANWQTIGLTPEVGLFGKLGHAVMAAEEELKMLSVRPETC